MTNETVNANLSEQDKGLLQRFKDKADEFMSAWTTLNSIGQVPANLQGEYDDLQQTGNVIQGTISTLTQAVDTVTGFFSDLFTFDGVGAVRNYINDSPQQLGIAPLIPIAAITVALGTMGKFITDVYLFERKVSEQQRLVASGLHEAEAAEIINKMNGQGFTANLANIAKPIAFTVGAIMLFRMINKGA
jgi:hypothetical protein